MKAQPQHQKMSNLQRPDFMSHMRHEIGTWGNEGLCLKTELALEPAATSLAFGPFPVGPGGLDLNPLVEGIRFPPFYEHSAGVPQPQLLVGYPTPRASMALAWSAGGAWVDGGMRPSSGPAEAGDCPPPRVLVQVEDAPPGPPGFQDVTQPSGLDFTHHLADGKMYNIMESDGAGGALLDFDRDGSGHLPGQLESGPALGAAPGTPACPIGSSATAAMGRSRT